MSRIKDVLNKVYEQGTLYKAAGRYRNKEIQSGEHDSREKAVKELFDKYPTMKVVHTSRSHKGWMTGSDMKFHDRAPRW